MAREGVIQYSYDLRPGSAPTEAVASALCAHRDRLFRRDTIGCDLTRYGACYGNVSARVGAWAAAPGRREFLVSCTQTGGIPEVSPAHLVRVFRYNHDNNHVVAQGPCPPSSETMTHGAIYDASLDVRAVVHGHDPELWQFVLGRRGPSTPEDVDYGTPEMATWARRVVTHAQRRPWEFPGVLAMAGHEDGVIAWGSSVKEAADRFVAVWDAVHKERS